mgnify:CR=1 FL=1
MTSEAKFALEGNNTAFDSALHANGTKCGLVSSTVFLGRYQVRQLSQRTKYKRCDSLKLITIFHRHYIHSVILPALPNVCL